jgi:anthranilate synthase/aminodeoxychorismate synthase-like glutamine amidotransferase
MRVLLIDNYDSFTYNVAHLFGEIGVEVRVMRNDDPALSPADVDASDLLVIGPGPGRPADAGKSPELIAHAVERAHPIFGICLGQQALGEYFGGEVIHAPALMHGKTSEITHNGTGIFTGIPSPFTATRYHSLCVSHDPFPSDLLATAVSDDGVIQGVAHRTLPIHAVQFHPESILTPSGRVIFENILKIALDRRLTAVAK